LTELNFRSLLDGGGHAIGVWSVLGTPLTVELASTAGYDLVAIDCQHGLTDLSTLMPVLAAVAGTAASPVVRVPSNDAAAIGRCLDFGAEGVIVPMLRTADDATQAVRATRYAPAGERSFGPIRASMHLNRRPPHEVNAVVTCIGQIETAEAVANIETICQSGIDALLIGPVDLGIALGSPLGGPDTSRLDAAITDVLAACHTHRVPLGIHTIDAADAQRRLGQGFRFVIISSEVALLRVALRDQLAAVRANLPVTDPDRSGQSGY
jgi:4-hydroxy-2-oxoheptanedioate aldolase